MIKTKTTIMALLLALLAAVPTLTQAKVVKTPKLYIFGFAASFSNKDSLVHITEVQEMDSVWMETKTGFLAERSAYSAQMRDYLASELELPHRTCIVIFSTKRAKVEKEFLKIRRQYTQPGKDGVVHYDARFLTPGQFRFEVPYVDPALVEASKPMTKAEKKAAKQAARQERKAARQAEKQARQADRQARQKARQKSKAQ